eukprot:CAMPEP_0197528082 /NCGR_PEP_ID=MMETSP1318-20131121/23802_1 /TAXON_ID=552666 /ORGANISM="Partenskyella glossopodia, Strain RCC365" /LENGTH=78 /DNA_ID=CAMNT_0043083007 /DNA_START=66 /DNA_END=302 /DNA_ORIENTATION=+
MEPARVVTLSHHTIYAVWLNACPLNHCFTNASAFLSHAAPTSAGTPAPQCPQPLQVVMQAGRPGELLTTDARSQGSSL